MIGFWENVPYDPTRLFATLAFMLVVVGVAVGTVRWRYRGSLIAQIATTLGIFLLIIGAIVYTAAFRGLRTGEMVVAWLLSGFAIAWFVTRLNGIMSRPLDHLDTLNRSIRNRDWSALLAHEDVDDDPDGQIDSALRDVALLIAQTQQTARAVLDAAAQVATIGGAAAEGARGMSELLRRVGEDSSGGKEAAGRIRAAADEMSSATTGATTAARETLEISISVESRAQQGGEHATETLRPAREQGVLHRGVK